MNFTFAHGHTRFVALHAEPGVVGETVVPGTGTPQGTGGTGLCSDWKGVCAEGDGRHEDRGALFHAVEVSISQAGAVSGRVLQAFAGPDSARIRFGGPSRRAA